MKSDSQTDSSAKTDAPLAIIGMGCLFPKAANLKAYWANIINGVDGIEEIPETHWNPDDYYDPDPKARDMVYAKRGGFLPTVDLDPMEFGISPRDVEAIDTTQLLGLIAAKQALDDAGYGDDAEFDRETTSVILGVSGALEMVVNLGSRMGHPVWKKALDAAGVDQTVARDVIERVSSSYVEWQENSFPGLLGNVTAGRIANRMNLRGTNCVVDAACASSLSALHLAGLELAAGRADMVVTGGMDTFNDIFMYTCFSKTPALSPTGNARPFNPGADGTILGEGLGVIVLKRLEDARRDKDNVYAIVRGIGSSSDGKGNAIYAPSSEGQALALNRAYKFSGVSADTVELVEAHGTGTAVGDAIELAALVDVFGATGRTGTWAALGSVKSQIGHTKAAAGAAGLIKTAMALHHKVLPPTIKIDGQLENAKPGKSPFYVNTIKRPWMPPAGHPRRGAVSSFGFGGSNFHVVLEEGDSQKSEIIWDGDVQIAAFSGSDIDTIINALDNRPAGDSWDSFRNWAARTRTDFDSSQPFRLLLVVEKDGPSLGILFDQAKEKLRESGGAENWHTPDGIYFGSNEKPEKLGVLFPGQGSQYVGMMRDLACQFPQMHQVLVDADAAFDNQEGRLSQKRLTDYIYPIPEFSDEARQKNEEELKDTSVAQPAIGAASLGLFRILEYFGLNPDAFAGHSYGELVALCAAGRYNDIDLHSLSGIRGALMAGTTGTPGAMMAIREDAATVSEIIKSENLDLVIANKNAPTQTVISGAADEIAKAAVILKEKNIRGVKLKVSNAFHSPLMSSAHAPFEKVLADIEFKKAQTPVYANSTAKPYPTAAKASRDILAGQLISPVEFIDEVRNMYSSGIKVFLEVGPNRNLTGMVSSILENEPHSIFAVDVSKGKKSGAFDLARSLAHLGSLGHDLKLENWDLPEETTTDENKKKAFTIPINGANYFKPDPPKPPVAKKEVTAPVPKASAFAGQAASSPEPALKVKTQIPADSGALSEALKLTQTNMEALQEFQKQTSQLHSQYLASQEAAQKNLQTLIAQQQQIIQSTLSGGSVTTPVMEPVDFRIPDRRPENVPQPASDSILQPAAQPLAPPVKSTPGGQLADALLEIVADQTGYPLEMLNLEMGLDEDLGIDSIKRVEILSALSERFPATPEISSDQLGAIQTLQQVVDFLSAEMPQEPVAPQTMGGIAIASTGVDAGQISEVLLQVVADQTGYPTEMLNLDMGLDEDLGIDSIKRVEILSTLSEILPNLPEISSDQLGSIQTLRQVVEFISAGIQVDAPAVGAGPQAESSADQTEISKLLLEIVAELTGYPTEMLNLDMGLDEDLGIDSIKRVEILSALSEKLPGLPEITSDQLGSIQTLGQVVEFLTGHTESAFPESKKETALEPEFVRVLFEAIAAITGYPVETLNLELELESELGLDPVGLVEIINTVGASLSQNLKTDSASLGSLENLAQLGTFINDQIGSSAIPVETAEESEQARETLARYVIEEFPVLLSGKRNRIDLSPEIPIWITKDDSGLSDAVAENLKNRGYKTKLVDLKKAVPMKQPSALSGLILIAPAGSLENDFPETAFCLAKNLASSLKSQAQNAGAVLVTVSRLDGHFGFNRLNIDHETLSGSLAGLAKTAAQEWPEVQVKALDVNADEPDIVAMAEMVADEALLAGPGEVGLSSNVRIGLNLKEEALDVTSRTNPLTPGDVVLVTGGARGVTSEAALALAEAWQPTLVLLGRSPKPEPEPEWTMACRDEASLKKALFENGLGKATPKQISEDCRRILANREIQQNINRLESAGSQVHYESVNVCDAQGVQRVVVSARKKFGPIKGIVHGAGVLADKLIEEKTIEQFRQVYSTKVDGLNSVLAATRQDDLKFISLFSSSSGRFGRTGQVDYSMANEVINKIAQREAYNRTGCKVVSFNWGPWAGGMVTPVLEKIFMAEGLSLIPLKSGAQYMVDELSNVSAGHVELVVLGAPSRLPVMDGQIPTASKESELILEREVSIKNDPYLESHVIDGQAVLPMAVMIDWMGHAALAGSSGLTYIGFDNMKVHSRAAFNGDETMPVKVYAKTPEGNGGGRIVHVRLSTVTDGEETLRAEADVVLADKKETGKPEIVMSEIDSYPHNGQIYSKGRLFHGPLLTGIETIEGYGESGITGLARPAPDPEKWMHQSPWQNWLTDPLILDSAFQMVILWCLEAHSLPALPANAARFRIFDESFDGNPVRIAVRIREVRSSRVRADLEFFNTEGRLIARIESLDCFESESLIKAYEQNSLSSRTPQSMMDSSEVSQALGTAG